MAYDVRFYEKENGEIPLADYLAKLRDRNGKLQIHRRIQRAALGNLGDHHTLGEGLHEMRIDCGPGYRVYFAYHGPVILLLLLAGDKSEQTANISTARGYLADFQRRNA